MQNGKFLNRSCEDITSEEADTTLRLDKARDPQWHPLSTQERLQLGRFAQRLASLLNRLLALAFSGEVQGCLSNS